MDIDEILRDDKYVKFTNPDFASAIVGVSDDNIVIYDYKLMIDYLKKTENMDEFDAADYIDFNRSFENRQNPIIMHRIIY